MAYEKMSCLYESFEDLQNRLSGSVCRYDGEAVYVNVESASKITLYSLDQSTILFTIKPKDPKFDISSPELGYMNYDTPARFSLSKRYPPEAIYVRRVPYRRYKQGISADCVRTFDVSGHPRGYNYFMLSDGMKVLIENRGYPSYATALRTLVNQEGPYENKIKSIAVSQELALSMEESGLVLVYFRTQNIGYIEPNSIRVNLTQDPFSFIYPEVMRKYSIPFSRGVEKREMMQKAGGWNNDYPF
jgi:hypothetical protein